MNIKKIYNIFIKVIGFVLITLVTLFFFTCCFYAGYKYGAENVLDSELNIVDVDTTFLNTSAVVEENITFYTAGIPILMSTLTTDSLEYPSLDKTNYHIAYFMFNDNSFSAIGGDFLTVKIVDDWTYTPSNDSYVVTYSHDTVTTSWESNRKFTTFRLGSYTYYVLTALSYEEGFNFNIVKFEYGYDVFFHLAKWRASQIKFFDTNGKFLTIDFAIDVHSWNSNILSKFDSIIDTPMTSSNYNSFSPFVARSTYYVTNNFSDNDYYNQGFSDGYSKGEDVGYGDGYSFGYDFGYDLGYDFGYSKGASDSDSFSYVNFFAGLFDAPVVMVYNSLNFDLFGVNLYNFFCGLITVFLCIALIKFIRGK